MQRPRGRCEALLRRVARLLDQRDVALQIGEAQQRHAGLPRAEKLAGTADERGPGARSRSRRCSRRSTLSRAFAVSVSGSSNSRYACALRGAAADAPAQLMELREPEALGVLDHHQRRVGHVDADFDHRGRDQHVRSRRATNAAITVALSSGFIRPCSSPTRDLGQRGRQLRVQRDRGLQLELFRLLDQRTHPVGLAALAARACRTRSITSPRRLLLTSRVATGVRPGGISSIAETSRSA